MTHRTPALVTGLYPRTSRAARHWHLHGTRAFLLAVAVLAYGVRIEAAERPADQRGALNVLMENDAFAATDRHYTNGLEIAYLTKPRSDGGIAAHIANWLPGNHNGEVRVGWQVGQTIFTPDDKEATELLPGQRPYAAWLYAGLSLVSSTSSHIDTWSLAYGTVGPDARGEKVQNSVHEWLDNNEAMGWDNQIGNQRGGSLIVERKWRHLAQTHMLRLGVDFMPHVGLAFGNIESYANAGITLRIGNDLDNDFGPPRIRPSLPGSAFFVPHDSWSWYLFAGVDGRYVEKNIFLDDNDMAELWTIDKKRWVDDAQAGLVLTRGDFRMAYTFVYRSEEFEQQLQPDRFGSLALTWRF